MPIFRSFGKKLRIWIFLEKKPGSSKVIVRNFHFNLSSQAEAEIRIFDLRGRLVKAIDAGEKSPGTVTLQWHGKDRRGSQVASGFYFYKLMQDDQQLGRTGKLCLIK